MFILTAFEILYCSAISHVSRHPFHRSTTRLKIYFLVHENWKFSQEFYNRFVYRDIYIVIYAINAFDDCLHWVVSQSWVNSLKCNSHVSFLGLATLLVFYAELVSRYLEPYCNMILCMNAILQKGMNQETYTLKMIFSISFYSKHLPINKIVLLLFRFQAVRYSYS